MNRSQLRIMSSVLSLSTLLVAQLPLGSQEQPTVFVHGLRADGTTWSTMRPTLEAALMISGQSPTLGWGGSYASQAGNLHSSLSGLNNVIAITHRNGGVLSRRYLTTNGAPRVNRHISLNSPHRGAKLAENALNGQLGAWAVGLSINLVDPFNFYYFNDSGLGNSYLLWAGVVQSLLQSIGYIDYWVGELGYSFPTLAQQLFGFIPAVLPEMVPGSSLLAAQLTPGALQAEGQVTTHRVSVSNELAHAAQPYSLVWQNAGAIQALSYSVIAFALDRYDHYSWHPDFTLRHNACRWLFLANSLADVPRKWAELNGSLLSTNGSFFRALKNDGVVTWSSSAYPGGSPANMSAAVYGEIGHTTQTASLPVSAFVRSLRQTTLGVPLRAPPPPVFATSIIGAATVPPYEQCNYSVSIWNGTSPFSYQWYVNGVPAGTSSTLSATFPPGSPQISVQVTDALLSVASAQLGVTTDPYSSGCF